MEELMFDVRKALNEILPMMSKDVIQEPKDEQV
jgi:hypothetical protein